MSEDTPSGKNFQIDAYLKPRPVKEHEKELLRIIQDDFPEFNGRFLDIGCAAGACIEAVSKVYPQAHYTGFDISEELIAVAKVRLAEVNASLFVADAIEFESDAPFGIIVASGVLSIFEDFEPVMEKWLSWLADDGAMYIFGRFNSADVDTIVRFRNNYKEGDWEGGLTSYSVHTIERFLKACGYSARFQRFHLNIDLPRSEDPIRAWTVPTPEGKLVVNGANLIAEQYFLHVRHESREI